MAQRAALEMPGTPEVFATREDRGLQKAAVPVPARWIDCFEHGSSLWPVDRRLMLLLLAQSWPLTPMAVVEALPAAEVRVAVGLAAKRGNSRLREAMERLSTVRLEPLEGGPKMRLFDTLELPSGSESLRWRFGAAAVSWGMGSRGWMRADLPVLQNISGRRAARLYFLLGLRARMKGRFWSAEQETLQRLMQTDHSWRCWSEFERIVLREAIERVEKATGWSIEMSRETSTRSVHVPPRVRFTINSARDQVPRASSPTQSFS